MKLIKEIEIEENPNYGRWYIERYKCPHCNKVLVEYWEKDGTTLYVFKIDPIGCKHFEVLTTYESFREIEEAYGDKVAYLFYDHHDDSTIAIISRT